MKHYCKTIIVFISAFVLLFSACKSLDELYEAGDYQKAFNAALKRLDKKPADAEALRVLEKSLDELITTKLEQFTRSSAGTTIDEWENALDVIAEMDELLEESAVHLSEPYSEEQQQWWADAVELEEKLYLRYLASGKTRLEESLRKDDAALGQKAYYDFERANHYKRDGFPEAEGIADYMAEALEAGTIYYKVSIDDGFNIRLGVNVDRAFGDLENAGSLFLNIEEVIVANDGDCAISIQFGEFHTSTRETQERRSFDEQVIVDYQTQTDTAGNQTEVPIYDRVSGQVEIVTSTKTGQWEVDIDVTRYTNNCNIFGNHYERQAESVVTYYRLSGDQRAIPDSYKGSNRDEHDRDEDLAEEILDDLVRVIYRDYFN